jgi:hypothetical protein
LYLFRQGMQVHWEEIKQEESCVFLEQPREEYTNGEFAIQEGLVGGRQALPQSSPLHLRHSHN